MLSINKPEIFVPEIGIGGNIKREGRVFRPSRERERAHEMREDGVCFFISEFILKGGRPGVDVFFFYFFF